MNREGVVQRRTARPQNGGLGDVQQTPQQDYDRRSGSDEDLEDMDSKETRLTLMEEVLLLGLKDKEVTIPFFYLSVVFIQFFFPLNRVTHHSGMIAYPVV